MNENTRSPLPMGLLIGLLVLNLVAIAMSYHALSVAREARSSAAALVEVQNRLDRLQADLGDMKRLAMGSSQFRGPSGPPPFPGDFPQDFLPTPVTDARRPQPAGGNGSQPPGTTRPGTPAEVSPQVLASHRKDLIDRNATYHQQDRERYGDKVATYYQAARADAGPLVSNSESDKAFSQLVSEYPEANATAMVIAEKAMQAAGRDNTLAVEEYYNMLEDKENAASIVLDSGVEAMPAIQSYLAYQYIQQGRTQEAETLLTNLEATNTSGLIAVPGPKGEPEYRPVSEVIGVMRQQMQQVAQ